MKSINPDIKSLKISDFVDKSLLILDDDDPFRSRLARAMEKKGFQVKEAKSVEEGLKIAQNTPTNFALVDLRLEDGSGLEVVKAIHKSKKESRIVMLTGYGNLPTAVAAVKAGAIDYIAKPVDADDVEFGHVLALPPHRGVLDLERPIQPRRGLGEPRAELLRRDRILHVALDLTHGKLMRRGDDERPTRDMREPRHELLDERVRKVLDHSADPLGNGLYLHPLHLLLAPRKAERRVGVVGFAFHRTTGLQEVRDRPCLRTVWKGDWWAVPLAYRNGEGAVAVGCK